MGRRATSPLVATVIFALGVIGLFYLDRNPKVRTSKALWIPVIWFCLAASRSLSLWFQDTLRPAASVNLEEGNPLERAVFSGLLVIGIVVLLRRWRRVSELLRANAPIILLICFGGLSILWSDYPNIAVKRWTKSLGDIVSIMIILTDKERLVAIKRFLSRTAFVLIPASVLLIKYCGNLGRAYNDYDGYFSVVGVTTDKNMLGMDCLVLGLGSVWRILHVLIGKTRSRISGPLIAHGVILAMMLWLVVKANSMTSLSCFLMASSLMVFTTIPVLGRNRGMIHLAVITLISIAFSALFLHLGSGVLETMGRDSSLTGRTDLWKVISGMNPNVLMGAGFESFWLGPRLPLLNSIFHWHPNEAHNGYLEVYLNLGWVGVTLVAAIIVTAYKNSLRTLRQDPEAGRLQLAVFLVAVTYSFTEAGFRMLSPVWIFFMFAVIAAPKALVAKIPVARDHQAEEVIHVWRTAQP